MDRAPFAGSIRALRLGAVAPVAQYMADAGVVVAASQLPDPMDAPQPGVLRVDAIIEE